MATGEPLFETVKSDVQFPKLEEQILALWDERQIFAKTLADTTRPTFSFYDGPPFATGLPHYGHILPGTIKDVVPRYWTMKGYRVPRRFGWDCHGLPVEHEINKTHGIDSRKRVLEMGIGRYNDLCRAIVTRYSEEWKQTVRRMGRWVDMDHAYFTMHPEFMQSVWWVFQQLWNQGLIYEGYKVVPYSTGLSSPLSNFEANLNYKVVQDPAVTVSFVLEGVAPLAAEAPTTAVLAWTTTPWTLPSNLALAVHQDTSYDWILDAKRPGTVYVVASALRERVFGAGDSVRVLRSGPGRELLGQRYVPLFDFFADLRSQGAFRIIHSDHVTTESGTGVVHMAPAFGEEDYQACKRAGLPIVNPVDDDGMFTAEVPPYRGQRVKDADRAIIADLKRLGRLFQHDTIDHSYPFCWRSDTPLIYRAVSSWFVAVEKFKDRLLAANQTTHWVPSALRDGRFGNWLENARDWAISRNRFWGTPIPVWKNEQGESVCVGSRAELEKLSGRSVPDLHMEHIDELTIPSAQGGSPLKRTSAVLDCWFESGSMPMAQWGYPFAHREEFEQSFPADFIAEGLDQTRGWFYTLMVIGTAVHNRAPFKHVVVNGLVLAEDGRKMSKSLRNYPDPNVILSQHGADALRLYLIDSPVVKAQELKFSEAGVKEIVRQILLRWWNAYGFFVNYANVDRFHPRFDAARSTNPLDQWVLSRLHSLIRATDREMQAYEISHVVPGLLQFVEELTNTYIRFNRAHFWQEGMPEDKRLAYETLYEVLLSFAKVMAPFAPFVSEAMYLNLARALPGAKESVHLEQFPSADVAFERPELEQAVAAMSRLVTLGRNYRERIGVKAKIPLKHLRVIHRDARVLASLERLEPYFRDELNVRAVSYSADEDRFVTVSAKARFPVLGKRLGARMKAVAQAIERLDLATILRLESGQTIQIEGDEIGLGDVEIRRAAKAEFPEVLADQLVSIELDPSVDEEQMREGRAREVIRMIQAARKSADFKLDDRIRLELHCEGALLEAVRAHQAMIERETLTRELIYQARPTGQHTESGDIEGAPIVLGVTPL